MREIDVCNSSSGKEAEPYTKGETYGPRENITANHEKHPKGCWSALGVWCRV